MAALLLGQFSLGAQTVVTWYRTELFPFSILRGELAGQGAQDFTTAEIKAALPMYIHQDIEANVSRFIDDVKAGKFVLHSSLLKTPDREVLLNFSKPYLLFRSAGVMIGKNTSNAVRSQVRAGYFDLQQALQHPGFTLGVIHLRRYGPSIDSLLMTAPRSTIVQGMVQDKDIARFLLMMDSGRLQAVAGYEEEFLYHLRREKLPESNFQFYWVVGAQPYEEGHFAAPRTPEGKLIIERIDALIPRLIVPTAERYAGFMSRGSAEEYMKIAKEQLLPPLPTD